MEIFMRVFLVTYGSHGDVYPIISIGKVLQEQGHEVLIFVQPYLCHDVEQAGIPAHPMVKEIDFEKGIMHPDNQHQWKAGANSRKLALKVIPLIARDLRFMVDSERPDIIVSLAWCVGVQWICDEFSVPCVSVALTPIAWPSFHVTISMGQPLARGIIEWMRYKLTDGLVLLASRVYKFQINRMCKAAGFPSLKEDNTAINGDVCLGLWSHAYRPATPNDPANSQICGFPFYDGQSSVEVNSKLWDFISAGDPPIVFTLGTTAVHVSGNFYAIAAQACEQLGRRGILLIGHSGKTPNNLPENVLTHTYAPLSELLPHACAVVHHGGIGCISQSLRAGCPMVVIPFAHDQFDNAQRVTKLGVGTSVKRKGLTTIQLTNGLRFLLDNVTIAQRCKEISERVEKENGSQVAAEAVLRAAQKTINPPA
jgi:rhamnosyltransferase subunit B